MGERGIHDKLFEDLRRYVEGKLSFKTKVLEERFRNELSWVWTEYHDEEDERGVRGKFMTEYWSERALMWLYSHSSGERSDNLTIDDIKDYLASGVASSGAAVARELRHEHVVPRQVFFRTLEDLKEKGEVPLDFKEKLCDRFFGCILTKKEANELDAKHRDYPNENCRLNEESFDCWIRYREYNDEPETNPIVVYKCKPLYGHFQKGRKWALIVGNKVSF